MNGGPTPPMAMTWPPDVPSSWEVKAIGRIFRIVNGSTPKSGEPAYWDGPIAWATPDDLGDLIGDTLHATRRTITEGGYRSCGTALSPGGSVVLSTRAPIGHVAIAGVPLCTNQGCRTLVLRNADSERFLFYQLVAARPEFESWGQGSTFSELSRDRLSAVHLAVPPLDEQRAIAAFLDRETARIDALVEKKRRQIELLHEKRAALISHAVTKGLDPTAPMKDSGIDWLGEIPSSWRALQFRRVICALEQGWSPVAEEREAEEEEWAILKISAVARGRFRPGEHKALPPSLEPESRYEVRPGDLLLTRSNTPERVGDACLVLDTRHRLLMSDLIYRLHLDQRVCLHPFACYWLISRPGRAAIEADARGTSGSMVKIAQSHIRAWPILVPPIEQQRVIVRHLDSEMTRLERVVSRIETSIDRLREYRTALISAAVTGKLDVRQEVA